MKSRRIKIIVIGLLALGSVGLRSQTLKLVQENGEVIIYSFNEIRKITFETDNMLITGLDNVEKEFTLQSFQQVNFTDTSTQVFELTNYANTSQLTVFPNPSYGKLNLDLRKMRGMPGIFRIISLEGRVVVTKVIDASSVQTIDIRSLTSGIYICQYTSNEEFKTVKFIKR